MSGYPEAEMAAGVIHEPGTAGIEAPPAEWALVEIFGHRRHYGRIEEVERFGAKMLRVDEPTEDQKVFTTHFYGGASIFSMTPCTEEAARKWHARYAPASIKPQSLLPPSDDPADDVDDEDRF